eukprot:197875-Pyramimonas_sp.AAC.1
MLVVRHVATVGTTSCAIVKRSLHRDPGLPGRRDSIRCVAPRRDGNLIEPGTLRQRRICEHPVEQLSDSLGYAHRRAQ